MGISIELQETQWYNSTYGFDILATLFDKLAEHNLTTLAEVNAASMPIVLSSFDLNDLIALSNMTDLPLV